MNRNRFHYYDAARIGLAIDPARPWQIITDTGCLIGQVPTEADAKHAVLMLEIDRDNGTLPVNLATWDKVMLLGR
jgi:hypothetical protein